jgi:hypothetical protein
MAIDAILQRAQLEQRVDVEGQRLLHLAVHSHSPGARRQAARILRGLILVHAEFVEIVVVGNVFEARQRLAGGGERALHRLQLGSGQRDDAG